MLRPQQIDLKRENIYRGIFELAREHEQPGDPLVCSDWDGDNEDGAGLPEPAPKRRSRAAAVGSSSTSS